MMNLVNLTPHTLRLRLPNGETQEIAPRPAAEGGPARVVGQAAGEARHAPRLPVPVVSLPSGGEVVGLPPETPHTCGCFGGKAQSGQECFDCHGTRFHDCAACDPAVVYLVSLVVLSHPSVAGRSDVFAPATGPSDGAVRYPAGHPQAGQVEAVTRLVGVGR